MAGARHRRYLFVVHIACLRVNSVHSGGPDVRDLVDSQLGVGSNPDCAHKCFICVAADLRREDTSTVGAAASHTQRHGLVWISQSAL